MAEEIIDVERNEVETVDYEGSNDLVPVESKDNDGNNALLLVLGGAAIATVTAFVVKGAAKLKAKHDDKALEKAKKTCEKAGIKVIEPDRVEVEVVDLDEEESEPEEEEKPKKKK